MLRKVNYMDSEMKMNMRASITNQTLRRLLVATLLSALVAGCGSGTISSTGSSLSGDTLVGGGGTGGGTGTGTDTGTGTGTGSTSVSCTGTSTGLAAEDLTGQCRATPQATMGALEAVSG